MQTTGGGGLPHCGGLQACGAREIDQGDVVRPWLELRVVTQPELHNYLDALEGHLAMLDRMHELITAQQRKMDHVCIKHDIDLKTDDGLKTFRREMHKSENKKQTAYNDILLDNTNWASWEMYLVLLDAVIDYYLHYILKKTPELVFHELQDFLLENLDFIVALGCLRDAILHPNALDSQIEEFVKCGEASNVHPYRFALSLHGHIRGLFHFLTGVDHCIAISSGERRE